MLVERDGEFNLDKPQKIVSRRNRYWLLVISYLF